MSARVRADSTNPVAAAWREIFDELGRLEAEVDALAGGRALDRAEGTRYLGRLLGAALARFDPRPGLAIDYGVPRIGGFNPDFHFGYAAIEPGSSYVLRGEMRGAHRLALSTHASALGSAQPIGHLSSETIRCDAAGRFEIAVGGEPPPAGTDNWLPTGGRARALLVRQILLRRSDRPAELSLERAGAAAPRELVPLDGDRQREALAGVRLFLAGAARRFFRWTRLLSRIPNAIGPVPAEIEDEVVADPDTFYALGYFDLGPDERLEVRLTPPPCAYWGLHTTNHWLEPIEHDEIVCHRNGATAEPGPDGSITLSIAPQAHPHPNSLHTLGHPNGAIFYRVIGAGDLRVAPPVCTVRRDGSPPGRPEAPRPVP